MQNRMKTGSPVTRRTDYSGNDRQGKEDLPVAVVIPMYRVEPYIQDVIAGIPDWISWIVVVDDASPDQSGEKVRAMADPRVVLIQHEVNQGVGGATISGFQRAVEIGAWIAVKMDGDGQMNPNFLYNMIEPILTGQADYTKGNRFFHVADIVQMPIIRRIGNLGLSFLTKVASGYWNVFDPSNGYIAIDLESFSNLDLRHIHRRYFFETSMLIELNLARAVVSEIPMPARYSGEISSLSIKRVALEFPSQLIMGFLRRIWLQYFVLDFSLGSLFFVVGIVMGLFGSVWGLYFWNKSIYTGIPASTGTVMIAVLPVILGFQLLLQAVAYDIQNVPKNVMPRSTR
jgi:dolichol-phosphate mannosyltransferase